MTEGFTSVEEVGFVPMGELAGIEGFDEDIADELQQRARSFLKQQNERLEARRQELGVTDEIAAIEGVTPAMLVALGEKGVKTLDDLADLAADELIEIARPRPSSRRRTPTPSSWRRAPTGSPTSPPPAPRRRPSERKMLAAARPQAEDPPRRRRRAADEDDPSRRCIVTGEVRPKTELVRFVVDPAGAIVPDVAARLPGRGLWLTARRDIVATAMAKRLFARAARAPVVVDEGLADRVERFWPRGAANS